MLRRILLFCLITAPLFAMAQPESEIAIYRLFDFEEKNHAFFSMSDSYQWSEHPDSLCVPDSCIGEGLKDEVVGYFELKGKYRASFLERTGTSEKDKVFAYDYRLNKEVSFKVKELKLMAMLSPYESAEYGRVDAYSYMIGFELPKKKLQGFNRYFQEVFVTVEAKSPFAKQEMEPLRWIEMDLASSPEFPIHEWDTMYGRQPFDAAKAYSANWKEYRYYLEVSGSNYGSSRLLVIDTTSNMVVGNFRYFSGESASLSPLNYVGVHNKDQYHQWTGQLFKDKAPVVYGFQYHSFGCASIDFMGDEPRVYLRCDNRH